MSDRLIPDIQPFIANDQIAVRYYLAFALVVFAFGVTIIGIAFHPTFKSLNIAQDIAQKIGGGFISSLSAFPLKEFLLRRDRLRILSNLEEQIRQLRAQTDPPADHVHRLTELVWEIYKKGATG